MEKDSFTANWESVTKADAYYVSLYGIETASNDSDDYLILDDDFAKATGHFDEPNELIPAENTEMNEYSDMPGWTARYGTPIIADGMIGVRGWGASLVSPELYLKGADTVTVRASVKSNNRYASSFYLACGSEYAVCTFEDGEWEGEVSFNTNGSDWGYVRFIDLSDIDLLVDYVMVSRSVKSGSELYVYQQAAMVDNSCSHTFSDLNISAFNSFAYNVIALRYEGDEEFASARSSMQKVVPGSGSGVTGMDDVADDDSKIVDAIYSPAGQKLSGLTKGLNIIHYKDGSSRKVMVK